MRIISAGLKVATKSTVGLRRAATDSDKGSGLPQPGATVVLPTWGLVSLSAATIAGVAGFFGNKLHLDNLTTKTELREDMHRMEDRLDARFARMEDRLDARFARMEAGFSKLLDSSKSSEAVVPRQMK